MSNTSNIHYELFKFMNEHGREEQGTVSGWVSVEDAVPKDGQEAVALCMDGTKDVITYDAERGAWWGCEGWWPTSYITHWMPLPEPPEEVTGG